MAANRQSDADFTAHERSYSRFAWMMKWGTIASAIVTIFVVWMIAS